MPTIRVYDPAMCCSTGVCGPDADATLAQFAAALDKAKKGGVTVDRFTLAHQPEEYVKNAKVKGFLDTEGVDCLPMVFVDEELVTKGDYPGQADLLRRLGIEAPAGEAAAEVCCGPAETETETETGNCCA